MFLPLTMFSVLERSFLDFNNSVIFYMKETTCYLSMGIRKLTALQLSVLRLDNVNNTYFDGMVNQIYKLKL